MAKSHEKGARGEREVVAMWRSAGFAGTMRAPGSGSLRSYGAGSPSPFPGDIIVKRDEYARPEPWLVEVKYDERVADGGVRTWQGSTFVMATLRDLEKEHARTKIIGREMAVPVLFARAARVPWSVWLPEVIIFGQLRRWGHHPSFLHPQTWVQLEVDEFFEWVVPAA